MKSNDLTNCAAIDQEFTMDSWCGDEMSASMQDTVVPMINENHADFTQLLSDNPFGDYDADYEAMYDAAPVSTNEKTRHTINLPHLKGGDKDKSVTLFNHICENYHFVSDNMGRYYACRAGFKAVPIGSAEYDDLFNSICVKTLGTMMASSTITTVKDSLLPIIKEQSIPAMVGIRSIYHNGAYYYKFDDTTVLQIAEGNFYTGVSPDAGVYFMHSDTFKDQLMPDFNSPATALPGLVKATFNVHSEDLLRFLAHLCCFFLPHINIPIMVMSGGHGTAKTTNTKKIISLADPSHIDVVAMPKDEQGLTALLAGKELIGLDNIGKLSHKFSDKFCIACTGGFDPQRQYYTNANLLSIPLKCNIIINGIGTLITRPDLAERSNVIYYDKISTRLTDSQVWEQFNAMKPQLLGSIFNVLRIGLPLVDSVLNDTAELPRMAEFAKYGAAFIKAMGLDPIQFVNEYKASCAAFVGDCAEMDEFNSLLKGFLKDRGGYYCETATKLLDDLNHYANCNHKEIDTMIPTTLSRRINQNRDDLKSIGVLATIKSTVPKSITLRLLDPSVQSAQTNDVS